MRREAPNAPRIVILSLGKGRLMGIRRIIFIALNFFNRMSKNYKNILEGKIARQVRKVLSEVERTDLCTGLAEGIDFQELEVERKKALIRLYGEYIKFEYLIKIYGDNYSKDAKRYCELESKIGNIADSLLEHIGEIRTIDASG